MDLDTLFKTEIAKLPDSTFSLSLFSSKLSNFSLINAWLLLKSPVASSSSVFAPFANANNKKNSSFNARFLTAYECMFNVPVSGSSALFKPHELSRLLSFTILSIIQRILN